MKGWWWIIKIEIVGSNCKNGMQLYKMASRAIDKYNPEATIEKNDTPNTLKKYNIKNIPGLVIDGNLICQGKVLSEREIGKLIEIKESC